MLSRETIKKLYPVKPLGEVVEFLDNLRIPISESEREPGEHPYYGANGQQGTINRYIFNERLILLAEDGGSFGDPIKPIAYQIIGKSWVNNHAHVLRPKKGLDFDFLFYQLQFYDVSPFVNGTTRAKLTRGAAEQIPIYIPDIKKQKKYSFLLNKISGIIKKRQETIKLADEFLRSTFIEMFGDPFLNNKNWCIVNIEEICANIVDCPHSTPKYEGYQTQYPCIRTTELKNGNIDWSKMKYLSEDEYKKRTKSFIPQPGDVVFGREGSFGETAIIPLGIKIALGQRILLFRPDYKIVNSDFLWYILRSNGIYNQAVKISNGSTVPHINVRDIKKFKTFLPPLDKQMKFAKIVAAIKIIKNKQENSILEIQNLHNSLMQRAFTGEL